jgi:hypothetical protein
MKLQKFVEIIRKNEIKVTLIFYSDIHIWGPSFWVLKLSGNLSTGTIWNFAKGT